MSRQQSRSSGDGAIDPSLVQKKRARHRLVGAICLCLIAAVIVPLVLESEPRPRDRDLPIEMAVPDRHPGEPAPAPAAGSAADPGAGPAAAQSAVKTVVPPAAAPVAPPVLARQDPKQAGAGDAAKADVLKGDAAKGDAAKADAAKADAAKAEAAKQLPSRDALKPEALRQEALRQDPSRAAAGRSDTSKAPLAPDKPAGPSEEPDVLARLIDRTAGAGAGTGAGAGAAKTAPRKFLVQIGAYSNVQSARTVSDRVVQVGLRPYQETVKTAQGDWIRVRVGPFTSREDAERAQQDLKRAGVTAAIIAL